jgi:hypothetical protein
MESMEKKWSTWVGNFSKACWICSPSMNIYCSIRGIIVEAHLNHNMEDNVIPWHLAYTLFGNVMLRPSNKLLKSCPPPGTYSWVSGVCMCYATPSRQDQG